MNDEPIRDVERENAAAINDRERYEENLKDYLGETEEKEVLIPPTSAQKRLEGLVAEYTPSLSDEKAFHAWHTITDAIADAHRHESYLTLKQLANAIIIGLSHWGHSETDGKVLAKEIEFLSTN